MMLIVDSEGVKGEMPREVDEIRAIVDLVTAPLVQQFVHTLSNQENLQRQIEQMSVAYSRLEEKVKVAEDDVEKLSKQIADLKESLLSNQQSKFKTVIRTQSVILMAVVLAIIGYMVPVLLQVFHK
jgi:predicted nuclease with TOPRIM domain